MVAGITTPTCSSSFGGFSFFPGRKQSQPTKKNHFETGIFLRFFADRRVELCLSRVAIAAEGLI